jgi:hypothetical protein
MNDRRGHLAIYLQPAFVVCVAVLAMAAAGMSVATQRLGLYLKKEPLPLKKPLDAMDAARLAPYRVTARQKIENADTVKTLETEDYIQWVIEDPNQLPGSSTREVMVFVTYYRQPDRVPHVPEECYTGGGYQRLNTDAVDFRIGGPDAARTVPGRYLRFEKKAGDISMTPQQFPVLYLFRVNGEYAGSRDDARMALNKNLFRKHSYFSKIELVFNQSLAAPAKEDAVAAAERLLAVLLPVLEQDHWPDLE